MIRLDDLLFDGVFDNVHLPQVFDLLSGKSKLRVMEDGKQQVVIVGLAEIEMDSVDDVLALINRGNILRTSGKTGGTRKRQVFSYRPGW